MKDSLAAIASEVRACTTCPLHKTAHLGVPGEGPVHSRVIFIGQAPGAEEDKAGIPFIGRSGKYLTARLAEIGLSRDEVFITSTAKHFPPKNRAPTPLEIMACRPYLLRQLALIKAPIVVLLGKTAATLLGHPALKGRQVLVTVHPSAAMRFPAMAERMKTDFQMLKKLLDGAKKGDAKLL